MSKTPVFEASKCYFTSDLHLWHVFLYEKFRLHLGRTIEEHNQAIVDACNEVVSEDDHLFLLGDLSFSGAEKSYEYLKLLNGNLHWVVGNHDSAIYDRKKIVELFDSISFYKEIKAVSPEGSQRLVLFHYPIISWNQMHHESWHLHGHTHGSLRPEYAMGKKLDVGFDCWYRPLHFSEVKDRMDRAEFVPVDHHSKKEGAQ